MGGSLEVSTDRGLGLQWWHVVAAATGAWALLVATAGVEELVGAQLYDAIITLALLAWPLLPVAMYLDLRSLRGRVAWEPATKSWLSAALVPIANVPVGLAYCVRRRYAVRGQIPPDDWRYAVYAGLLVWVGIMAVDGVASYVGADLGPLEPALTGLLLVAWLGLPVAVYFDALRFSRYPDRQPRFRGLVVLAAVPLLNVLLVGAYSCVRWWERRKRDPGEELALHHDGATGSTGPDPVSPWYRRAVGVFVVYVLLVFVVGFGLPLESDGAWIALELVAWLPFGIFFTWCLHLDVRDVRDAGVPWGGTRYLYYSSVVFPGPAFYYLLRRLLKVHRARSRGLLDEDAGGTSASGDPATIGAERDATPDATAGDRQTDGDPAGFEWAGESSR